MTTGNRDDLDQDIRDLFDAPAGAVERVVEGAFARPGRTGTVRTLPAVAAALALTSAAAALWLQPRFTHPAGNGVVRVFPVGDLTLAVDEDGTSWVVGPAATSADDNHLNLIIVEEQQP